MGWLANIDAFIGKLATALKWDTEYETPITYVPRPPEAPKLPQDKTLTTPSPSMNPDTLLPWNTTSSLSHENWHNVRVLCDLEGLSHEQKEELCATVWAESEFNTHAKCVNYGRKKDGTKYVASTDNGICQWNDYYHGSEITPDEAVNNPEKAVRLMCKYWLAGRQSQWVAHINGSYKSHLGKTL